MSRIVPHRRDRTLTHFSAVIFRRGNPHLAVRRGCTETEATNLALAQVTDWTPLARRLTRAEEKGSVMSSHVRTLWIPGLTILGCTAAVLLGLFWFAPGEWWANQDTRAQIAAGTVLLYALLGAVGAAWSRSVGGTWRERLGAGLLPRTRAQVSTHCFSCARVSASIVGIA